MFKAAAEERRPSARDRGYDTKWQRESKAFLALPENRFCACGCGKPADMADHKVAHKGDRRLFWDRSNWQPMARGCNSRKAVREEGAFGTRPVKGQGEGSSFDAGGAGPAGGSRAQHPGNWSFRR